MKNIKNSRDKGSSITINFCKIETSKYLSVIPLKSSAINIMRCLVYVLIIKKQDLCLSVCLYRGISLTAEPIWFSFTMWILNLIGPGKVYHYFWVGYHNMPKRNRPRNSPTKKFLIFRFKTKIPEQIE